MRFSTVVAATALTGTVLAADHVVKVGSGGLKFDPDNIDAAEGDNIIFEFYAKNHSVAQATFANPCEPMNNGFWSGFIPASGTSANGTSFMFTVKNASAPVWFYCTQGQHCQSGMVGVINEPNNQNTLDAFKEAAANASSNVSPTSTAGSGGEFMQGTSMSPSSSASGSAASTGAASTVQGGMAFTGLMGMFAYLMM